MYIYHENNDTYVTILLQIQRESEEAQRMLSTHASALQHTATQTATPQASVKTDPATSSSGMTHH